MEQETPTKLATLKELVEYLQVSENTIRKLLDKGEIPFVTVGGMYRFDLKEVRNSLNAKRPPRSQ
tara:strand:- start:1671 stop:1865 length:195 start_codon:yes stop_codon:yes gene_type:complete